MWIGDTSGSSSGGDGVDGDVLILLSHSVTDTHTATFVMSLLRRSTSKKTTTTKQKHEQKKTAKQQ